MIARPSTHDSALPERTLDGFARLLLYTLVFLLPLLVWPGAADVFGALKVAFLRILGALLLASELGLMTLRREVRLPSRNNLPLILAGVLFLLVVAATVFSVHPATSLFGLRQRYFGLLSYLPLLVIFYSVLSREWSAGQKRLLIIVSVSAAGITGLVGLLQIAGVAIPMDVSRFFGRNPVGMLGNPNFLGLYLAVNFALGAALVHTERDRAMRVVWVLALLVFSVLLIASRSLGALVGGIAGVAAFYAFQLGLVERLRAHPRLVVWLLPAGAVLLAAAGLLLVGLDRSAWDGRVIGWDGVLALIRGNPLLGVGPDAVRLVVGPHTKASPFALEISEDGHNLFLTVAVTAGLPALAVFALFVALVLRAGWSQAAASGPDTPLARGLLAALIAYGVGQQVNPEALSIMMLASVLAALVLAGPSHLVRIPRWIAGSAGALALALLLILPANLSFFMAEVNLYRAQESRFLSSALTYYDASGRLNPYYSTYPIRKAQRIHSFVRGDDRLAQEGITAARRAIEITPLESDNWVILGSLHRALGEGTDNAAHYRLALDYYAEGLKLNPHQVFGLKGSALAHEELGNRDEARRFAERYLALAQDADVQALLARVSRTD